MIAARYGAQSIPLLVLLEDPHEVDRSVGALPLPRLKSWLEPHLTRRGWLEPHLTRPAQPASAQASA